MSDFEFMGVFSFPIQHVKWKNLTITNSGDTSVDNICIQLKFWKNENNRQLIVFIEVYNFMFIV
jgi:hypothetical protein